LIIDNLPSNIDELTSFINGVTAKTNQYCWTTIRACANAKLKDFEDEQAKWIAKYVIVAEETHTEMSAQQCAAWIERTKAIPTFFSDAAVQRYRATKMLIESRLHASRVEGLIAMYEALTEAEKIDFKHYLNCYR
jgi:hypothetical protein